MTLIGLISDTHDNVENIKKAISIFKKHKIDLMIHTGDIVAPFTLTFFQNYKIPKIFIRGNNDGDVVKIKSFLVKEIVPDFPYQKVLDIDNKKIILVHGHQNERIDRALQNQKYDYLIHGHSHLLRDQTVGRTRIINPGAQYYKTTNTVAILEPSSDILEVINVITGKTKSVKRRKTNN